MPVGLKIPVLHPMLISNACKNRVQLWVVARRNRGKEVMYGLAIQTNTQVSPKLGSACPVLRRKE
eukprot:CAMPEP_0172766728 /NCGR_PEP_ID=MMETSP1074-20121228/181716_1 /TAXON_ID=2916 /ORGANISM="Ceratium fusus, Strain PA161109" /LENGTH=64 /DNA_ID=CAMNT_0013601881 /DNA_START=73 /DNA_END=264 /DNA_ORIENTATION=+